MRVVHLCRVGWPSIGGMESAVHGLARAQVGLGHAVTVVTLARGPDGAALPEATHEGVAYRRIRRVGPRRYPFGAGLARALRGAELVHAHGLDGLADQAVATRPWHGAPVGISTHGGYFHTARQRRLKAAWLRTLTALTLARADAVWFTSEADRARLAPSGARGEVLLNGVDVARFAALPRRPEPGRWVVPGRVDVHKGHVDLLDALGILRWRDDTPFRVDIVGPIVSPRLEAVLRARIEGLGLTARVFLHGAVDDAGLDALLLRAELALFPSRYEGFGLALVEAMAAGLPVIARDIPPFRALVEEGGWLLPMDDPEALADTLARLRTADLSARGARARQEAAAHGWAHRVHDYERAYARVLERR